MEIKTIIAELTKTIRKRSAAAVQSGPFAGMIITEDATWHSGNAVQKILGIYEQELHQAIEEIVASQPDLIVNVGCAEGYYAVGFALRVPGAIVHVFDVDSHALSACERAAVANRADRNLRLELGCSYDKIARLLRRATRPVVFADCEGCEVSLFTEMTDDDLKKAVVVIEMHEFIFPGSTNTLSRKLQKTHLVRSIRQSGRDPHEIPLLQGLPENQKWLAMSEGRPKTMNWLYCVPRHEEGCRRRMEDSRTL